MKSAPTKTEHLRPDGFVERPVKVSIVVPTLNEQITVGEFVEWCKEGLRRSNIEGQILIVDSSTDDTPDIALALGAEVLRVRKRGLGAAYVDAIPYIRGQWVIMGDADLTYDFREIDAFLEKFAEGYEFVMGSRFRGTIEKGAMPPLHQYFGTPVTTKILNFMYRTDFTDIHCGMRGLTRSALKGMGLSSMSWEYASEMLIKAVHMGLRRAEVPIVFRKEPTGRQSHHVRIGWFSPWLAGWENLRAMFVFGADFFLWWPGIVLMVIGLFLLGILVNGPVQVIGITLSLNSMLLGLFAALTGLQMFLAGVIVKVLTDGRGLLRTRWGRIFSYTRTTLLSTVIGIIGAILLARFIALYVRSDYLVPADSASASLNHQAVLGMFLIVAALIVFTHMLIIQAIRYYVRDRRRRA